MKKNTRLYVEATLQLDDAVTQIDLAIDPEDAATQGFPTTTAGENLHFTDEAVENILAAEVGVLVEAAVRPYLSETPGHAMLAARIGLESRAAHVTRHWKPEGDRFTRNSIRETVAHRVSGYIKEALPVLLVGRVFDTENEAAA